MTRDELLDRIEVQLSDMKHDAADLLRRYDALQPTTPRTRTREHRRVSAAARVVHAQRSEDGTVRSLRLGNWTMDADGKPVPMRKAAQVVRALSYRPAPKPKPQELQPMVGIKPMEFTR